MKRSGRAGLFPLGFCLRIEHPLNTLLYVSSLVIACAAGFHYGKRLGAAFLKALLFLSALLLALFLMLSILWPGPGEQDKTVVELLLYPNLIFKTDWNLALGVGFFCFALAGLGRIGLSKATKSRRRG